MESFKQISNCNCAALLILFYIRFMTDCAFSSCSYWDMAYDGDVMDNRIGLNLLYAQVRDFISKPDTAIYFQLQ